MPTATESNKVYNQDIVWLDSLIRRFMYELYKSASSGTSSFSAFDQARLASYLDELDRGHAWVLARPLLDYVEYHPTIHPLELPDEIANVENESINNLIVLFESMRVELLNCQSARHPSGLQVHDSARFTSIVAKTRSFLVDFIVPTQPTDLPKSSPQEPMSGPGKKGT